MLNFILFLVICALIALIIKSAVQNAKQAKINIESQQAFLSENKKRSEIIETASGLQYEVITPCDSGEYPTMQSNVTCHYHGTLLDGTVFDSSVERNTPLSFKLNQVIPGWTEVLQQMKCGEKVKAFIPYNLAYGKRAVGKIPPASLLVFEIELIAID